MSQFHFLIVLELASSKVLRQWPKMSISTRATFTFILDVLV
jgi:hypothetical protein